MTGKKGEVVKKVTKIVVEASKRRKKPRRNRRGKVAQSMMRKSLYSNSVVAPFSRAAEGARLPDGCPINTSTYVLAKRWALVTDASGNIDVTVMPNLALSAMSTRASLLNGVQLVIADTATGGYKASTSVANFTGTGFDVATLTNNFNKYRVVSYGVRVRGTGALTDGGEYISAVHPLKGYVPGMVGTAPGLIDPGGTTVALPIYAGGAGPRSNVEQYLRTLGLPYSGGGNTAALESSLMTSMPNHAVTSHAELASRGLHFRGVPFEASAREFRSTDFSALGVDSVDVAANVIGSFSQQYAVDLSAYKVGGHESVIIAGARLPVSQAVAVLEVVYHIEGIPNPNLAVIARPSSAVPFTPPPATLDTELTKLHKVPRISFSDVVTQIGDTMLGEVEGRANELVRTATRAGLNGLTGMLARLVASGA